MKNKRNNNLKLLGSVELSCKQTLNKSVILLIQAR